MKLKYLVSLLILPIMIVSCSLEGESNSTPAIFIPTLPVNNLGDSLNFYYTSTSQNNVYRLDTISVGDTVTFKVYLEAYDNFLTGFYLKQLTDSTTNILLPDQANLDSIFNSSSDFESGDFIMDGTYNRLVFPFRYIALKPDLNAGLTMTVTSDANFSSGIYGTNSSTIQINTPIISK